MANREINLTNFIEVAIGNGLAGMPVLDSARKSKKEPEKLSVGEYLVAEKTHESIVFHSKFRSRGRRYRRSQAATVSK